MESGREAERLTNLKAFEEFGAHKVYGRIPATNEAAKKAVIYNGWKQEGVLRNQVRHGDELIDVELWGGFREDLPEPPRRVTHTARLIEDLGLEASDAEFFRSAEFFAAEGVTHTLAIGDAMRGTRHRSRDRGCGSCRRDLSLWISGRPSPSCASRWVRASRPQQIDWSETGLVSVFVRDRIGESRTFAGGTVRNLVQIAEGDGGIRKRLREQIRRNERRGWEVRFATGPEDAAALTAFKYAYDETMARTGAAERYLYPREYFETLLKGERLLAPARRARWRRRLAGAIAVLSDRYLHYYLGGTADDALGDSPMKNLFAAMIKLGRRAGRPGQPRRRAQSRRLARGLQARLRQRGGAIPHARAGRRPRRLRGARGAVRPGARGLLPRISLLGAGATAAGCGIYGKTIGMACSGPLPR